MSTNQKNTFARRRRQAVAVGICVAMTLAGCAVEPGSLLKSPQAINELPPATASSVTIWQARRTVVTGLRNVLPKPVLPGYANYGINVKMHPDNIRVTPERIDCEFDLSGWGFGSNPTPSTHSCDVELRNIGTFLTRRYEGEDRYWLANDSSSGWHLGAFAWPTLAEAQAFAGAANRLRFAARGEIDKSQEAAWREFQQQAAAWRALPVKPAISEEVRQHRLLAEDALKQRQFDSAVEEYEAGLAINPVWPEGHFNAALLCAEAGYFAEALRHMRAYLELSPDAPDAQQARDQIVLWQARLAKRY